MKKLYTFILLVSLVCSSFAAPIVAGDEPKLRCYPNPASATINFEFTKKYETGFVLVIYNSIGKKVNEQALTSSRATIALDAYFRGIYLFQLKDKSGKIIQTGRFQVAK